MFKMNDQGRVVSRACEGRAWDGVNLVPLVPCRKPAALFGLQLLLASVTGGCAPLRGSLS